MFLKHSNVLPKSVQQLFLVGVTETTRTKTITTSTTAKSTTDATTTTVTTSSSATTTTTATTTSTTTEADFSTGELALIYYITFSNIPFPLNLSFNLYRCVSAFFICTKSKIPI